MYEETESKKSLKMPTCGFSFSPLECFFRVEFGITEQKTWEQNNELLYTNT